MAAWNEAILQDGDLYGIHDVGLLAWTIRWKTAGWAYRDAVWVWEHCGLLVYNYSTHVFEAAEMGTKYQIVNKDKYKDNAGDNPGIQDIVRGRVFVTGTYPGTQAPVWMPAYCRLLLRNMAAYPTPYDFGLMIGSLFGTGAFKSGAKYLCSEMTANVIMGCEKVLGVRSTKTISRGFGAAFTFPYWANLNDSNILYYLLWPKYDISTDLWSPWLQMKYSCGDAPSTPVSHGLALRIPHTDWFL